MSGTAALEELRETQPIASVPELYGSTPVTEDDDPCPMAPETYKAVFEFHGRDMLTEFPPGQFDGSYVQFSPQELMVRQDLAKNKARWSDDYYRDRERFLDQVHPVLALYRSHRLHTISRTERSVVYVVQIFFVLLVSLTFPFAGRCGAGSCETVGNSGVGGGHACVFPFTYKEKTYDTCTAEHLSGTSANPQGPQDLRDLGDLHKGQLWCSVETDSDGKHVEGQWGSCFCQRGEADAECWKISSSLSGHRQVHAVLCCMAHHTGVAWFSTHFNFWGIDLGGTLYASVLNTAFALFSFQLMICGCVQRGSAFVRRTGEQTGHVVYGLFTILILIPQPYLIMYAFKHQLLLPTLWVFLSSKIASYLAITVLQMFAFHFIWNFQEPHQHEDDVDGVKSDKPSRECMPGLTKFHVTSAEYEAFMRDRRERGISKPIIDTCQK